MAVPKSGKGGRGSAPRRGYAATTHFDDTAARLYVYTTSKALGTWGQLRLTRMVF